MDIGLEVENILSVNITSLKEAPIHISSKIQPHGILLVLAEPDLKILQVTDNTLNVFGRSAEDMVQKRLVDLLDAYQLERIKCCFLLAGCRGQQIPGTDYLQLLCYFVLYHYVRSHLFYSESVRKYSQNSS